MDPRPSKNNLLAWTAQIICSHVRNNAVPVADLPGLIGSIYNTLGAASTERSSQDPAKPAVAIRHSVSPDHIVCLEDGKKFKMLKRHLRTAYDMTPDEYRRKWSLPPDYPMVAPNYTAQRRALAKKIGLGGKQRRAAARN